MPLNLPGLGGSFDGLVGLETSSKLNLIVPSNGKGKINYSSADPNYNNVVSLIKGSFGYFDSSSKLSIVTASGSSYLASSPTKFNSFSFANGVANVGAGHALVAERNSGDFNFGTGDFTIEMWVYPITITPACVLLDSRDGVATNRIGISLEPGNLLGFFLGNSYVLLPTTASALILNSWNHIAVTRSGGFIILHCNGVQVGGTTAFPDSCSLGPTFCIGGSVAYNLTATNAFTNEIRITKGVARYFTASFTPPTGPF
jgi:hypothetical protein